MNECFIHVVPSNLEYSFLYIVFRIHIGWNNKRIVSYWIDIDPENRLYETKDPCISVNHAKEGCVTTLHRG